MHVNSPCKDCENKGCGSYHDKCEKYAGYKEQLDRDREEEDKHKSLRNYRKKFGE